MIGGFNDTGFWLNAGVLLILLSLLYSPLWLGLLVRFGRQRHAGKRSSRLLNSAIAAPICLWVAFGASYLVSGYVQDAPARRLESEVAVLMNQISEISFAAPDGISMDRHTDCASTTVHAPLEATPDDDAFRSRIARLQQELRDQGWVADIHIEDFNDGYTLNYPWRRYAIRAQRARTSVSISITAGYRPGDPLPTQFRYDDRYLDKVSGGGMSAHFERCSCDHQIAFVPTTCGVAATMLTINRAEFSPDRRKILLWTDETALANWRCNYIDAGVEPDGLIWTLRYRSTPNARECLPAPPTELGNTASIDLIEPAAVDVVLSFG